MRWFILLVVFAVGACGAPPPPIEGDITGYWHGKRWEGKARVLWLSHLEADGALEIEFITCFNGERLRWQRQIGTGYLRNGIFETRIERQQFEDENGELVRENEEGFGFDYRVTELTAARMRYQSDEFGERYEVTRVESDFVMDCPPATLSVSTQPDGRRGTDAWIRRGANSDNDEGATAN